MSLAQRLTPPLPPLPNPLPEMNEPSVEGILGLEPTPTDELGVGHLRPSDLTAAEALQTLSDRYTGASWLQATAFPIYVEAEGQHWGWIVNGWLVPNGQSPIALGRDASFLMLQTYADLFSFPVTEIRDDGWFQFKYTSAGTAWAHIGHLNVGRVDLAVERWEDRFLDVERVQFRQHGLSRPLRAVAANDEEILGLIGPDSLIEPIAFDGDWMQVRVTQPVDGCETLPGSRTQEGWMRWRDVDNRSLIWYPPEGC